MDKLIKCPMCWKEISPNADCCPNCGEPIKKDYIGNNINRIGIKNNGTAVVLSFIFPGLGQLYNGQIGKGFLHMIRHILLILFSYMWVNIPGGWGYILISSVLAIILWIRSILDAKKTNTYSNNEM